MVSYLLRKKRTTEPKAIDRAACFASQEIWFAFIIHGSLGKVFVDVGNGMDPRQAFLDREWDPDKQGTYLKAKCVAYAYDVGADSFFLEF